MNRRARRNRNVVENYSEVLTIGAADPILLATMPATIPDSKRDELRLVGRFAFRMRIAGNSSSPLRLTCSPRLSTDADNRT